jgi:hypothetical protein
MSIDSLIMQGNDEEWIAALPRYQTDLITLLIRSGRSPEDIAQIWSSPSSHTDVQPFGIVAQDSLFLRNLKEQMRELLCGSDRYKEERTQIVESFPDRTAIVSTLSALTGAHLGLSAVFIAPIVIAVLLAIRKVGLSAWCETQRSDRQSDVQDGPEGRI